MVVTLQKTQNEGTLHITEKHKSSSFLASTKCEDLCFSCSFNFMTVFDIKIQ